MARSIQRSVVWSASQEKIKLINDKVAQVEPKTGGLLKTELQASITKLEEVWEGHLAARSISVSQFSQKM